MRIGICDDEKPFIDLLFKFTKNSITHKEDELGNTIIETFSSGEALLRAYDKKLSFDVLFLDIKMKNLNGFETAKYIRSIDQNVIIIFVTSMEDQVFRSFEFKPFWYLVKPVTEAQFSSVFLKALGEFSQANFNEFTFQTRDDGVERVNIKNIIYLESLNRKIQLHTVDCTYSYYGTISSEEKRLQHADFIRIHKSYLVNVDYIQKINKSDLLLKNGQKLLISQRRHKEVFDYFTEYLTRYAI